MTSEHNSELRATCCCQYFHKYDETIKLDAHSVNWTLFSVYGAFSLPALSSKLRQWSTFETVTRSFQWMKEYFEYLSTEITRQPSFPRCIQFNWFWKLLLGHGSARLQSSPSSNSFTCRTWGRCSSSKSREWKVQLKINAIFFFDEPTDYLTQLASPFYF